MVSSDNLLLIILFVTFFGLIGAVIFVGMRAQKRLTERGHPLSSLKVTPTGVALTLAMITVMFISIAATVLEPDGPIGSMLRVPAGFATGVIGLLLTFWLFALLFAAIGSPIIKQRGD